MGRAILFYYTYFDISMNMKAFVNNTIIAVLVSLFTVFGLTSCDKFIYEDLEPCGLDVRFIYDYNLKYADAFPHEVKKVDLFIFDEQGVFIENITVENDAFPKDYLLHVNLPQGKYQFITWAGLYDRSYDFPNLIPGKSTTEDIKVAIKHQSGILDRELDGLWHGIVQDVTVGNNPDQIVTVPLVKDTNIFRLIMISKNPATPIDASKYDFEIISDNGYYTSRNEVISGNVVMYTPYYRENLKNTQSPAPGLVNFASAVVELNTGRLMDNQENILIIRDKSNGKVLLEANLNELIFALKLEKYSGMPMQEFLDRKDEYVLTFIFTEGTAPNPDFLSVEVFIEDWLVREQKVEK